MSVRITLRVRTAPGFRVDASALLPVPLAAMTVAQIEGIVLSAGHDSCKVGDVFDVTRSDSPTADETPDAGATLVIENAAAWLDRVGARMTEGHLMVQGAAGDYSGFQMTGGVLQIEGDAGHFTGCEMRGGRLTVTGHNGDFAAGALAGDMEGMTGGTLIIHGNTGARLADRMHRGLVLVGGNAGDFAAARLVAGTIGIAGEVGAHYAYGMRRGTLLLARRPTHVPTTFTEGGRGFDVFWALLVRSLAEEIAPFSHWRDAALPTRYAGDLAVDGRGEILVMN
ncbi:formylmethanofuran dehydrogenase subunit C [Paraburkholderia sp. DHOC27]|uniref:formylmethanofuran dehydrogenase subunit C n=1 Tax=Paraburkholderia sp. DHOC27 TaxID=2303330 RepID=UPI000E3C5B56|nr:formylmethanofuran dehydrogenase subunit C [Paraburkholderia sp. DHOC27]RFU49326.1 formylmethanofuran dehydrogenase subunit C [Paraburkholderia sp. DHOC27]